MVVQEGSDVGDHYWAGVAQLEWIWKQGSIFQEFPVIVGVENTVKKKKNPVKQTSKQTELDFLKASKMRAEANVIWQWEGKVAVFVVSSRKELGWYT